MLVKTTEQLHYYDGKPLFVTKDEPLTIGALIRSVMNTPTDEPWTPETIVRCGNLATATNSGTEVELNDDDRAFIKARAVKVYAKEPNGPLHYGLLNDALSDPPALAAVEEREEAG